MCHTVSNKCRCISLPTNLGASKTVHEENEESLLEQGRKNKQMSVTKVL